MYNFDRAVGKQKLHVVMESFGIYELGEGAEIIARECQKASLNSYA